MTVHALTASRSILADYVTLTKPRIISLLLLGALAGIFPAARGNPELSIVVVVLIGGALAAGGANAVNQSLEWDLDVLMRRTRNRPVASGRVAPWQALIFGVALNVAAFLLLWTQANLLSAILALSGTLFYVFVYTMTLKRTTAQNIVIGGAAGSVPPVVGWAAVTGGVDLAAVYLFAIVFMWTPPHFWALSLLIKDDYQRAGVPMLPVVKSIDETARSMMAYTIILVGVSILPATTDFFGWIYLAGSVVLGAVFLLYSGLYYRRRTARAARQMYLYSLLYLALLFALAMADSMVAI